MAEVSEKDLFQRVDLSHTADRETFYKTLGDD